MKMFIVKEEKEYKIFRVQQDEENTFQKEYGKKVVAEGANLGELINRFQELDLAKMSFNREIGKAGELSHADEVNSKIKQRNKFS